MDSEIFDRMNSKDAEYERELKAIARRRERMTYEEELEAQRDAYDDWLDRRMQRGKRAFGWFS